ncbi:hypothetical protein EIN_518210 [Entamoeba invadens IP1]|uniref:Leucine rich repeat containing protein BspA family protein n=1 Tax=Entamoeba invadens IP1 TaxID=370355 RepID=L7FM42_ENTIV|nr:hypothetical protein EIN_518210 [Entamoeba invadens IP1]ELP85468.1 hypothetical protein EIN_518210 [Entamoeba invadens IP1]|eukprot:XP_004184814.1 hypothetical protein EIN_518210 [Entamoeba invadens IP1]
MLQQNRYLNVLRELRCNCFKNCHKLRNINIPYSVQMLEDYCFANCSKLDIIELPKELMEIGAYCFANDISLTGVVVPSKTTKIGDSAFERCERLSFFSAPENIDLGNNILMDCKSIESLTQYKK